MKVERLLTDVNLSDIVIPAAGSKVILSFLNMRDGGAVGSLICSGLVVFAYQTFPESGLPQYVGEVNHALVSRDEARVLLQRLRYGFKELGEASASDDTQIHHVHIEGGEVAIEVVCKEVQFLL